MTAITIELPDDVARSAEKAGILSSQTIASVVRELVRQSAARTLQQAMRVIDLEPIQPHELSEDDIGLAINAARGH